MFYSITTWFEALRTAKDRIYPDNFDMARDDQRVFLVLGYEELVELFSRCLECQERDSNASLSALNKLARALDCFGVDAYQKAA